MTWSKSDLRIGFKVDDCGFKSREHHIRGGLLGCNQANMPVGCDVEIHKRFSLPSLDIN